MNRNFIKASVPITGPTILDLNNNISSIQSQVNAHVNNISGLVTNINNINSRFTTTPKLGGKVYGSGNRGERFGPEHFVNVESTGQYLITWSGSPITVNAIMMATINATPPSGLPQTANIQYVSANSVRIHTYNGATITSLPFSFTIY